MNKVKLPKEVAEAVQMKFDHYSQEGMAYMMLECSMSESVISKWIDSEKENIVKLSQTLVELYKTVQTLEDKVRSLYNRFVNSNDRDDFDEIYASGVIAGIKLTLESQGIWIEGVNT